MDNTYAQPDQIKADESLNREEVMQKKRIRWVKAINIFAFAVAVLILVN